MFRVAIHDFQDDCACSFTEFLCRLPAAYAAPSPVRILAWCSYVMKLHDIASIDLSPIMGYDFVDQVNIPFQLRDPTAGSCLHGRAFSWGGDYCNLDDLIDAVKHGHSIDWADVKRKLWSHQYVTDGGKLNRLLSSARNPSKCLENIQPANLRNLLRTCVEDVAVRLAHFILKHGSHRCAQGVDNPYFTAMWTVILHDANVASLHDFIRVVDLDWDPSTLPCNLLDGLLWAREYAQDMLTTTCNPHEKRTVLLAQALVLLSVFLSESKDAELVEKLAGCWKGSFAMLLMLPSVES
eukprot:TRINITY_DN49141_c0_g1_i1.p1 TRINITY_DN49141_c0_g1~~TRINITY_DN49141_c0_g1_i1.p1  ORF type:complete len:308 (-),score=26.80 TRINITY_DN49141_c0_g1_i1:211-1095(-)